MDSQALPLMLRASWHREKGTKRMTSIDDRPRTKGRVW